jgi:alkanesulfonate monooxygenase SsuD/methylene tetrahydromethanopterin reductase-like flavin-dependent oxidoreductase (luciferase family)
MIEGQEDVTWEQWVALAEACERSGIETLFRSDHYLSFEGEHYRIEDLDALPKPVQQPHPHLIVGRTGACSAF